MDVILHLEQCNVPLHSVTTSYGQNVQKRPYMEVFKFIKHNILWLFFLFPLLDVPFGVWNFSQSISNFYALA